MCYILKLVIIIDYGFAFVLFYEHDICTNTRLKETKASPKEIKGVQFPAAEMIGAANRQSPVPSSKISSFASQEHQIRMRSDERDKSQQ